MIVRRSPLPLCALLIGSVTACSPPRLQQPIAPRFPEMLRSAEVPGGRVVARAQVDRKGRLTAISVSPDTAAHVLFAQAVKVALRKAQLRPARRAGLARGGAVEIAVRFVLLRPGAPPPADVHTRWVGATGLPAVCPSPTAHEEVVVCARADWQAVHVVYE
jgi:hypothetical protein